MAAGGGVVRAAGGHRPLRCAALGLSDNSAVLAGLWATMALLAGWALLAGRRSGLRTAEMLLYVAVSLALELALIAIKSLLH